MKPHKKCLICGEKQRYRFEKMGHDYYQCRACGLLSTFPIPEQKAIEEHYKKNFEEGNYERLRYFMQYYIDVYRDLVERLEKTLRFYNMSLNGLRTLDIGCFTGELVEVLREKGADSYGLELQDKASEIANSKLPGRIFKADISNDNFPPMKFDVVTLLGVLEHIVDPKKLLRRSVEILNPGGILMLQTPNNNSLVSKALGKNWPCCFPVEHIHIFSEKCIQKALYDMGLAHVTFESHWKKLPIAYYHSALRSFDPGVFKMLNPIYNIFLKPFSHIKVPLYVGEVVIFARKD